MSTSHLLLALVPAIAPQEDPVAATRQFFQDCRQQEQAAYEARLDPEMDSADRILFDTLYELSGIAPVELGWPEDPHVNADRALVPITMRSMLDDADAVATTWLWFHLSEEGAWRLLHLETDARYSREWVYEIPQEGLASSAEQAATQLLDAMEQGDLKVARRSSSNLAWEGVEEGLVHVFNNARDLGLTFAQQEPQRNGARAIVPVGLERNGQRERNAFLYVEVRGAGWIATGMDHDSRHAQSFLAGTAEGTRTPATPYMAVDLFTRAVNQKRPVRSCALSSDEFRTSRQGLPNLQRWAAKRGTLKMAEGEILQEGNRCVAGIEFRDRDDRVRRTALLMLENEPGGWRVVGETELLDRATTFLKGHPDAR